MRHCVRTDHDEVARQLRELLGGDDLIGILVAIHIRPRRTLSQEIAGGEQGTRDISRLQFRKGVLDHAFVDIIEGHGRVAFSRMEWRINVYARRFRISPQEAHLSSESRAFTSGDGVVAKDDVVCRDGSTTTFL